MYQKNHRRNELINHIMEQTKLQSERLNKAMREHHMMTQKQKCEIDHLITNQYANLSPRSKRHKNQENKRDRKKNYREVVLGNQVLMIEKAQIIRENNRAEV